VIQTADLPPTLIAAARTANPGLEPEATVSLPTVPEAALYPLQPLNAESTTPPSGSEPVLPLKNFLRDQEQAHLNRALQHCSGDKEKAALLLGISLATLYRKLAGEDKEA